MDIIIGSRRSGKTLKLIELANNCNGYIITSNEDMAQQVFSSAVKLGYKINFPITYNALLKGGELQGLKQHNTDIKIWINDLDMFLKYVSCGLDVAGISLDITNYDKLTLLSKST